MSKKDEFKVFVQKHPELLREVKENNKSWQNLFEVYDLYGEDSTSWEKYLSRDSKAKTGTNAANLGELTKLIKNINMDNVQKYIETAQKAIGIVQELTKGTGAASTVTKAGPELARPINKIFED